MTPGAFTLVALLGVLAALPARADGLRWKQAPPASAGGGLSWEPVVPATSVVWDVVDTQAEEPATASGGSGLTNPSAEEQDRLSVPVAERYQPPFLLSPYLGGGVPSADVAGWGDFYIGGSIGSPGKLRDGTVDASLNLGFGLGDSEKLLALELDWGIGSIKNFNYNGGLSATLGRTLLNRPDLRLELAGGVLDLYEYGNEQDSDPASPWGAISANLPVQLGGVERRLQLTLGAGGVAFAPIDSNFNTDNFGVFAAIGVEITRNTGLSAAWSGRGVNANLSYVPFRDLPISVNIVGADLLNQTPTGAVGVLSITWGGNYATGVF